MKSLNLSKSFVIDCKSWYRGKGTDKSRLLNKNHTMCCLGFLAKSSGCKNKDIYDISCPSRLAEIRGIKLNNLIIKFGRYFDDNNICINLMSINDNELISDNERITLLTKIFNKIGIKVRFINKPK